VKRDNIKAEENIFNNYNILKMMILASLMAMEAFLLLYLIY